MALQNSEVETRAASGNESIAPFTLDEINDAIAAARVEESRQLSEEGYLTAREWAVIWNRAERTAQRKLKELLRAGLVDVREIAETSVSGQRYTRPVYKILIKKEG